MKKVLLSLALIVHLPAVAKDVRTLKPTMVFLAETSHQLRASGGNSAGIGGDSVDQRFQSAWFYGDEPIKVCMSAITQFGLSKSQIESVVKKTLKIWQDYFKERSQALGSFSPPINTNFAFQGPCRGEEDLRLYFGTGPIFGNLDDQRVAQSLGSPVAYVNKTHLSSDLKWSRGYIRLLPQGYYSEEKGKVFPNWTISQLQAVLLHEVGHILGFTHIDDTIMKADVAGDLIQNRAPEKISIDEAKPLLPCLSCKEVFHLNPQKSSLADLKSVFAAEKKLQLVNQGQEIEIQISGKAYPIKIIDKSLYETMTLPVSNFPAEKTSENFLRPQLYHLSIQDSKKTWLPATLEREESAQGWILRVLIDGEMKRLAHFELAKEAKK